MWSSFLLFTSDHSASLDFARNLSLILLLLGKSEAR